MARPLRALIVEDNELDAELLVRELECGDFQVECERVDTPEDYTAALNEMSWDVIFSDHSMPHFSSFQALDIRNKRGLDIPFIILSGTMGEDLAVEAMKAGASDYFVKGKLMRLVEAVRRELEKSQEREIRRKTEWELEYFIASLTHDLRTPILAELRVFELLHSEAFGSLHSEQHAIIEELIQSNHFVQHMVNNILYAHKYKQSKVHLEKQKTDLAPFISTLVESITIQSLLKEKSLKIRIEPTDSLPCVSVDRNEIQRVFLNLIKNAVDHSHREGTVTLSTDWHGKMIRVSVQDNGPGVDSQIESNLFTPYITSATKKYRQVGIGLGLYLSKQIIEAHGGRIGYERGSEDSIFYFELPVADDNEKMNEWEGDKPSE